uniref:Fibronectin type-III domain-containing protein n=1 Tax=Salarias fasciatus TaxID=181472 RepID=A0A672GK54_SALFA
SNKQRLMVSWLLNHCGSQSDVFEIQISRTEKHNIVHSVKSGEYTWTWTSELPLECVDHSVRIRNICNVSAHSPWSDWKTSYGEIANNKVKIFPYHKVLSEGSSATFCCVPPKGEEITGMAFRNKQYSLISVGDKVKAIAVNTVPVPEGSINRLLLTCSVTNQKNKHVFNYVGFPPQKPQNISCETTDFIKVNCTWGSVTKEDGRKKPTHTLRIQNTDRAPFHCDPSRCVFPVVPQLQVYNISVEVKNELGEEMESYSFNISERVRPVVEWDNITQGATDANISWSIQGNLTQNNFICQVSTPQQNITESCERVRGFCKARLKHLLPNTTYAIKICCSVSGSLWGHWTEPRQFTTDPLVILDVWRRIQLSDPNSRRVTVLWKQVRFFSSLLRYRVRWSQEDQMWKTLTVDGEQTQAEISVGLGKSEISVEAVLHTASSIPAHIIVPPKDPAETPPVQKRLSGGTAGAFCLSWSEKTSVSCGYTVEWCILGGANPCTLGWMKVPKENNTLFLPAENFEAGRRYTFNVYGCNNNGDKLLETQTGYSQELIPEQIPRLVQPVQKTYSSVTLEWLFDEDDPAERAFITGYLVTWISVQDAGLDVLTDRFNVSDPRNKSVTIQGLQQDQEYSFSVSALSKVGSGVATNFRTRTPINYHPSLVKALTAIFILLGCILLLWSRWKILKELFAYPPGMNIKTPEFDSFLLEMKQLKCCIRDTCFFRFFSPKIIPNTNSKCLNKTTSTVGSHI